MNAFERLARREFFGIKLGLDNVEALTEALGHPERTFLPIIIAGTNGKGSVAAITARALHAAGHRVGLYTSPHLRELTERFRIDDVDVSPATLEAALTAVLDAEAGLRREGRLQHEATYFELTTVAAFEVFRRAGVEVAVVEVGLGGRFDATNVVRARYAAITSIAFDHMAYLGTTLAAIAREKAGVITPGATVVSGVRDVEPASVVREVAAEQGAAFVEVHADTTTDVELRGHETWCAIRTPPRRYGPLRLALNGRHQADNAAIAVRLLESLVVNGQPVPQQAIETGLRDAVWPARLQVVERPNQPLLVIDGAHNPAGASALAAWLRETAIGRVTLVLAVMRDKDVAALLSPLLGCASAAITTTVLPPRGLEAEALADAVRQAAPDLPVTTARDPGEALEQADRMGLPVVVAGSLILAGAVLAHLRERPEAP